MTGIIKLPHDMASPLLSHLRVILQEPLQTHCLDSASQTSSPCPPCSLPSLFLFFFSQEEFSVFLQVHMYRHTKAQMHTVKRADTKTYTKTQTHTMQLPSGWGRVSSPALGRVLLVYSYLLPIKYEWQNSHGHSVFPWLNRHTHSHANAWRKACNKT